MSILVILEQQASAWNKMSWETLAAGQQLGAALGDLPDEQAQMLKLAYYDDRSHSEIAEALHVPLGTVKSRLRLAIGRLRAKFEDKQ